MRYLLYSYCFTERESEANEISRIIVFTDDMITNDQTNIHPNHILAIRKKKKLEDKEVA